MQTSLGIYDFLNLKEAGFRDRVFASRFKIQRGIALWSKIDEGDVPERFFLRPSLNTNCQRD